MDFARQQRDPTKHMIGIAFVILVHALVIWAMVSGLARTVVEVIKKPITATIIEEIKAPPPPPPPPKKIVEAPKVQTPVQQTYVPPPDVQVATTQSAPVISATTTTVPTEPHVITPPPVVQAPPAPPKPAIRRGITRLSGEDPSYPREAIKAGVAKGRVLARVMIDEKGNVTEVIIVSAEPPRVFDRVVRAALETWKFHAEGEKYVGEIEINFTLKDD
jgi:protein TonB